MIYFLVIIIAGGVTLLYIRRPKKRVCDYWSCHNKISTKDKVFELDVYGNHFTTLAKSYKLCSKVCRDLTRFYTTNMMKIRDQYGTERGVEILDEIYNRQKYHPRSNMNN